MAKPAAVSVDGMTKADLLKYAAENGIDGVSGSMLKAEIKSIILNN